MTKIKCVYIYIYIYLKKGEKKMTEEKGEQQGMETTTYRGRDGRRGGADEQG